MQRALPLLAPVDYMMADASELFAVTFDVMLMELDEAGWLDMAECF